MPICYLKNMVFEEQQDHEEKELKLALQALRADIGWGWKLEGEGLKM